MYVYILTYLGCKGAVNRVSHFFPTTNQTNHALEKKRYFAIGRRRTQKDSVAQGVQPTSSRSPLTRR